MSDYSNLPESWPVMYSDVSMECNHQMHWVDESEEYECINGCGRVDEEPPERKIEE